jgi:hypothetical protein
MSNEWLPRQKRFSGLGSRHRYSQSAGLFDPRRFAVHASLRTCPHRFTSQSCFVRGPAQTSVSGRSQHCCSPVCGCSSRATHPYARQYRRVTRRLRRFSRSEIRRQYPRKSWLDERPRLVGLGWLLSSDRQRGHGAQHGLRTRRGDRLARLSRNPLDDTVWIQSRRAADRCNLDRVAPASRILR